jgi:peptide/nickel transport system permease protein
MPLHLLLFALITFALIRSIPGDPVILVTGGQVDPDQYEQVKAELGLDGSLLNQLWNYLTGLGSLSLGDSYVTGRAVRSDLFDRLPSTIELAALAMVGIVLLALVCSAFALLRPGNPVSRVLRAYSRTAGAVPDFCIAVTGILVFYVVLGWVPAPLGRLDSGLQTPVVVTHFPALDALLGGDGAVIRSMAAHMVLPVAVMVLAYTPIVSKQLILGVDQAAGTAQSRFRVSTGAPRTTVLLSVYRRAAPSAVVVGGSLFGSLLGGAVVMESLFSLGGLGQYAVDAVNSNDLPALQGVLLVTAAISLLVFLCVDLVNMTLDPRRRPGVRKV